MKKYIVQFIGILCLTACGSMNHGNASESESIDQMSNEIITFKKLDLAFVTYKKSEEIKQNEALEITLKINLDEGTYNGKSGCNNYFGTVELVNKDQLLFYPGGMTEMLCPQDIMEWEALYMNSLTEGTFYVNLKKQTVVFTNADQGTALTFKQLETSEE